MPLKKKNTIIVKMFDSSVWFQSTFPIKATSTNIGKKYRIDKNLWKKYLKAKEDFEALLYIVTDERVLINNEVIDSNANDGDYVEP